METGEAANGSQHILYPRLICSTVNLDRANRVCAATGTAKKFSVRYRLHRMMVDMNYGNRNTSGYNKERINWDDSFKITASGHIAPALPLQPKILLQTSSCLIIIIILLHIFTVEQSLVYMMNITVLTLILILLTIPVLISI